MSSHSDQPDLLAVGRYLAAILRHKKVSDNIGLKHDAQGWMSIAGIIEKSTANRKAPPLSVEIIDLAVQHCDKQRYAISPDRSHIRAKQGHSFPVDLGLKSEIPPVVLYHGTVDRFFNSIMREGLTPQKRQHVHLSHEKETALNVGGRRKGEVIILEIDAKAMLANGYVFHLSENGVWLTEAVPSQYIIPLKR